MAQYDDAVGLVRSLCSGGCGDDVLEVGCVWGGRALRKILLYNLLRRLRFLDEDRVHGVTLVHLWRLQALD